jgi:hypothetical protein
MSPVVTGTAMCHPRQEVRKSSQSLNFLGVAGGEVIGAGSGRIRRGRSRSCAGGEVRQ